MKTWCGASFQFGSFSVRAKAHIERRRYCISNSICQINMDSSIEIKPGKLVVRDFRPRQQFNQKKQPTSKQIRIVQWNIERGYKLQGIIDQLESLNADIIALQEIDIGCQRSDGVDTGFEIAQALGMNYAFVCEFEELYSKRRTNFTQGGGFHGNAILTKFDFDQVDAIAHTHHPVNWNQQNIFTSREPRKGSRYFISSLIKTPFGHVQVYSVHLEIFCGVVGRMRQFADVLDHSRVRLKQGIAHQAILGDLNTIGHGVARFSPKHCRDAMRTLSIGREEAQLWDKIIFKNLDVNYTSDISSLIACIARTKSGQRPLSDLMLQLLVSSAGLGVKEKARLSNPGFIDPFDIKADDTFNYKLGPLRTSVLKGKLDWTLLRRMAVHQKLITNHDLSLSDHKVLAVDVSLEHS